MLRKSKQNLKIGFDLDGVLATQSEIEIVLSKSNPKLEMMYYRTRKPNIDIKLFGANQDTFVIITCRKQELKVVTLEWCAKFFPNIPLYVVSVPQWKSDDQWQEFYRQIAEAKAPLINELKLDVYFEDIPFVVQELRRLCPHCRIIQYGGRI